VTISLAAAIITVIRHLDTLMSERKIKNEIENENDIQDKPVTQCQKCTKQRLISGILLVGFIIFIVVDSTNNQHIKNLVEDFLDWVENNPVAGFFAFTGVYFIATILLIPGSILTLGSGFIFAKAFGLAWGVLIATLAVFFGASLGALGSFFIGRYLLRDLTESLSQKYTKFRALDSAFRNKGLQIMFLVRLSPIIPFNVLNYICGTTGLSVSHYAISLLGILPGTLLYVFLGSSAGSLSDTDNGNRTVTIIAVTVGVVLGIIAITVTTYYAKKELNKIVDQEKEENMVIDGDSGEESCHNLQLTV